MRRALVALVLLELAASAPMIASDFAVGDVFVGGGGGGYQRYSSSGVRLEWLDTGYTGPTTGCKLDAGLNLYATVYDANRIVEFAAVHPHSVLVDFPTNGLVGPPDAGNEAVRLDASGHLLVGHSGHSGGGRDLHRYDNAGALLEEYPVASEKAGSDWFDLSTDGCTLFYTSEGTRVLRYDVCSGTQLGDFAVPGFEALDLRLLPPGDGSGGLILADLQDIKRFDGSGAVVSTYDAPGEDAWECVSLAPGGQSFWATAINTKHLYRFNLSTGLVELGPIALLGYPFGMCVAGESKADICPGAPNIVRDLLAVRRSSDIYFQWRAATDAATDHYDPWKVVNGDKTLIPVANGITALTNPSIVAACPAVPRLTPNCTDAGVVQPPPPLLFYQIRGACTSGVEGTDHPF